MNFRILAAVIWVAGLLLISNSASAAPSCYGYKECLAMAEKGDVDAQYGLGMALFNQDLEQSFKWLSRAAEQGHPDAQEAVGGMYYHGVGVKKDHKKAYKLYLPSAQKGNPHAQLQLSRMYMEGDSVDKNDTEAFKWALAAAQQGYTKAQSIVGAMYWEGMGTTKNLKEAYAWLSLLVERNDKDAQEGIDSISSEISSEDLTEAKKLATDYKRKYPPKFD